MNFRTLVWACLLGLWLAFGTWWLSVPSDKKEAQLDHSISVHEISDSEKHIALQIAHNNFNVVNPHTFSFPQSSFAPIVPKEVDQSFVELVDYLKMQPGTRLILTGFFADIELNETSFGNLGLARANAIKSLLADKGLDTEQIHINSSRKDDLAFINNTLEGGVTFAFYSNEPTETLYADATNPINKPPKVTAATFSEKPVVPVNIKKPQEKPKTAKKNNSTNIVEKKAVVAIPVNSTTTSAITPEKAVVKDAATVVEKTPEEAPPPPVEKAEKSTLKRPILVYFDLATTQINMTKRLEQYIQKIKYHLRQNPKAKLVVTGHTDNNGRQDVNFRLGEQRALKVSDFLVQKGIRKNNIKVLSLGSDRPIASNDTQQGRIKNRRVEIKLVD